MFGLNVNRASNLQVILNKASQKLANAESNFIYINNPGITLFQLSSQKNGFELGISSETHNFGPVGNYAPMLGSFLTGKSYNDERIPTKGVNTNGSQVKLSKLAYQHKFWYSHLCRQIERLLNGYEGAVNSIVHPIAKHTFKDDGYKPCPVYVQYQIHQATNSLSVIANYRSQHLYMLAINLQQWAFQLLQLCHKFKLKLGDVILNCNNHHILKGQNPEAVCGKQRRWFIQPGETQQLIENIIKYYQGFQKQRTEKRIDYIDV